MWLIVTEPYDDGIEAFYVESDFDDDTESVALDKFRRYFTHYQTGEDFSPRVIAIVDLAMAVAQNEIKPPKDGWLAYAERVKEGSAEIDTELDNE